MQFGKKSASRARVVHSISGHKAEFNSSNKPLYIYVSASPNFSEQAKVGRRFVYLMLLNFEGISNEVPFSVGQSDNLGKRLSRHKHISWHVDRFNQAVPILIAGTVPETLATLAAKNLTDRLVKSGYLMKDIPVGEAGAWGRKSSREVAEYASGSRLEVSKIIRAWQSFWAAQEKQASKKRVEEGTPFLTHPDVLRFFKQRHYPSAQAVKLAQRLAADFNPLSESSILFLPYRPEAAKRRQEIEAVQSTFHSMNGDWYLDEPLRIDSPVKIKLAKPISTAISTRSNRVVVTPGTEHSAATKIKAAEIARYYGSKKDLQKLQRAAIVDIARYFDFATQSSLLPVANTASFEADAIGLIKPVWQVRERHRQTLVLTLTAKARSAIISARGNLPELVEIENSHAFSAKESWPTKKQVLQLCREQDFAANSVKRLAARLAQAYDEAIRSSEVAFGKVSGKPSTIKKMNLLSDIAALESIWYTNEDVHFGEPIVFFMRSTAADEAGKLA